MAFCFCLAISDILVNEHGPFCVSLEKCLSHEVVNSFVGVICHISVYSDQNDFLVFLGLFSVCSVNFVISFQ